MRIVQRVLATLVIAAIADGAQSCETGWAVVDLSRTGLGSLTDPMGLNNTGWAVGDQFLWRCGLPPHPFGPDAAHISDVNDEGIVVGSLYIGGFGWQAFRWDTGPPQLLGTVAPGNAGTSYAFGLNDAGMIVGQSNNRAFVWQSGVMTPILPSVSDAFEVSNTGYVVGSLNTGDGRFAFRWQNGTFVNLGTLRGGSQSIAFGVNNAGSAVGYSAGGGYYDAFVWTGGPMQGLPRLNGNAISVAFAINDANQTVGYSTAGGPFPYSAVLWENGQVIDLQNRVWLALNIDLEEAFDINASGWILVSGTHFNSTHAYLIRPAHLADVNCDGPVNIDDLVMLIGGWGSCSDSCPGDVDHNRTVNIDDLVAVITSWGPCP